MIDDFLERNNRTFLKNKFIEKKVGSKNKTNYTNMYND